jgi:hypothetical protein
MTPVDLSRVVSAGVGPIIVISACAIMSNTFYNRMANVITRLRAFQRERLAEQVLLDRETDDALRARRLELLAHLSTQTDSLMRRVRVLRKTIFCLLGTIASLVICSMSLGLSVIVPQFIFMSIGMFLIGLTILLTGLSFAVVDLKLSLDPVLLETTFVTYRLRRMDRA